MKTGSPSGAGCPFGCCLFVSSSFIRHVFCQLDHAVGPQEEGCGSQRLGERHIYFCCHRAKNFRRRSPRVPQQELLRRQNTRAGAAGLAAKTCQCVDVKEQAEGGSRVTIALRRKSCACRPSLAPCSILCVRLFPRKECSTMGPPRADEAINRDCGTPHTRCMMKLCRVRCHLFSSLLHPVKSEPVHRSIERHYDKSTVV